MVKAFYEILGINDISVTDNFFDLGGHSLKATKLRNEIEKLTGIRINLNDIFYLQTPEKIAGLISSKTKKEFEQIEQISQASTYLLSSAQLRMFLIDQMSNTGISYNIPNVLK